MRLRLAYEAARLSMALRGFPTRMATLPPGLLVPAMSFLDGRAAYRDAADASHLVVLVHGLGSSIATWSSVFPAIATAAPAVAPDLPGYGRTPLPAGAAFATFRDQVAAAGAFLEAVSPDVPVHLVGQSMGGWIAARLAIERPDRVARLTLVNPAGVFTPQVFEQRRLFTPHDRRELRHLWRRMWHRLPYSFYLFEREYLAVTRKPNVRGFLDSVEADDFLNADLDRLRAPTLLVWGLSDGFIDYGSVRILRDAVPDLRVRLIPDCGHVVQRERPEEFLHYVLPWLRGAEAPEATPERPAPGPLDETVPPP